MARTKKTNEAEEFAEGLETPEKEAETSENAAVSENIRVFEEKTIYVGPNIARYGLTTNAIYGEGTAYPSEAVEKIPAIKKLLIPVREFAPALPNNLRLYYNRVAAKAKEI